MLRFALCDDEEKQRLILRQFVSPFGRQSHRCWPTDAFVCVGPVLC